MKKPAFIFIFFLLAGMGVLVTIFQYTNSLQNGQDIRSHASNPADRVTDSDALLSASEQSLNTLDSDVGVDSGDVGAQNTDLQELNGL